MVFYILLVRKNCENILTRLLICDKISRILGLKGVKNMSKTVVRKNESLDDALRRFKRAVTREFYEKPSVKRKRKSEAARKRKKF